MAQIKMPAWNGEEVVEYQSYKRATDNYRVLRVLPRDEPINSYLMLSGQISNPMHSSKNIQTECVLFIY